MNLGLTRLLIRRGRKQCFSSALLPLRVLPISLSQGRWGLRFHDLRQNTITEGGMTIVSGLRHENLVDERGLEPPTSSLRTGNH
jgi:hypothetical protein